MFQHASAHEFKAIKGVDEHLTGGRVISKRSHAELAAGNGQVERCASLRGECNVNDRRQRRDPIAGDAVSPWFSGVGFDVRRNELIDSLDE